MKFETYVLPAYWALALINGDSSELEDDEIKKLNTFCKDLGPCVDMSEENVFSWHNDANNLGGAVATFTFQILEHKNA